MQVKLILASLFVYIQLLQISFVSLCTFKTVVTDLANW